MNVLFLRGRGEKNLFLKIPKFVCTYPQTQSCETTSEGHNVILWVFFFCFVFSGKSLRGAERITGFEAGNGYLFECL